LEGNVVVAGAGEWLEIWNPEQFEAEMAAVARWQEKRAASEEAES